MKRYAKHEKKTSDSKYKKISIFFPIVTFLSTSSSGHVKCSFHDTGETLLPKVHRRFSRGPKTLRKVTICSEKNVSSKNHLDMQNASLSTLSEISYQRKKILSNQRSQFFFLLMCWCKHVEHSFANTTESYAKKEKKTSHSKYKKSAFSSQ